MYDGSSWRPCLFVHFIPLITHHVPFGGTSFPLSLLFCSFSLSLPPVNEKVIILLLFLPREIKINAYQHEKVHQNSINHWTASKVCLSHSLTHSLAQFSHSFWQFLSFFFFLFVFFARFSFQDGAVVEEEINLWSILCEPYPKECIFLSFLFSLFFFLFLLRFRYETLAAIWWNIRLFSPDKSFF